jgi:hypothetical protein
MYRARGQAEYLIKATANQFRLPVHTAAYWLMLTLRGLAPKLSFWRAVQFDIIRSSLLKIAARVTEMATRIKVALPTACPYRDTWLLLAERAIRRTTGQVPPPSPCSANPNAIQTQDSTAPPLRTPSQPHAARSRNPVNEAG